MSVLLVNLRGILIWQYSSNRNTGIEMEEKNELIRNLDRLHTTPLGMERMKHNLKVDTDDMVEWCRTQIKGGNVMVVHKGKNLYVSAEDCQITVNAQSYTIITAHIIPEL